MGILRDFLDFSYVKAFFDRADGDSGSILMARKLLDFYGMKESDEVLDRLTKKLEDREVEQLGFCLSLPSSEAGKVNPIVLLFRAGIDKDGDLSVSGGTDSVLLTNAPLSLIQEEKLLQEMSTKMKVFLVDIEDTKLGMVPFRHIKEIVLEKYSDIGRVV